MPFFGRLKNAFSKLASRRSSRSVSAPAVIQSLRPGSNKVATGEEQTAPTAPILRSRPYSEYRASTPPLALPEPNQVRRLSAIVVGPDSAPESVSSSVGAPEEVEEIAEGGDEHLQLITPERPLTAVSTASSDYSNHSISHSLFPSTPVPPIGVTLMGSHLIDTPPPTPPGDESPGGANPAWGGAYRGRKPFPLIPHMSFIERRYSAPGALRVTEDTLGRLETDGKKYGGDHNQFTPDDSPTTDQIPHDIPTSTDFETRFSKPIAHTVVHPAEAEHVANLVHREVHTSTIHTRIQPTADQEYLPTKHRLEVPTGDVAEVTEGEDTRANWWETWRGEFEVDEEGCEAVRATTEGASTTINGHRKVDSGFGSDRYMKEVAELLDGRSRGDRRTVALW